MFIGLNTGNQRVFIEDAVESEDYFCPCCGGNLRIRNGEVNVKHFAHVTLQDCDDFSADMSGWHRRWQEQFPLKNREVVIEHNGEKHRADVLACGYVIEFQHSPISREEFNRRNDFYTQTGRKVVWIFDFTNEFDEGRMEYCDSWKGNKEYGGKFCWKHPCRFLKDYIPQESQNVIVFFQTADIDLDDVDTGYIERVVWAINEDGESDFKRFLTSYYPGNKKELLEWVKSRAL